MSSTSSNPLPISLPRFSPAALLLALALAAMLSMVVGIAAYTVHTGSGISQSDLAAAQHNAYQSGHDAGYTAGLAKGKAMGLEVDGGLRALVEAYLREHPAS